MSLTSCQTETGTTRALSAEEVLQAVAGLAAEDPDKALLRVCGKLLAARDWETTTRDLPPHVHHYRGSLRQILELPGELILLRKPDDSYALLRFLENRWVFLDARGMPLPDSPDVDSEVEVEAVAMKLESGQSSLAGLKSLRSLWPKLRAAWAEVGLASLYINAGQLLLPIFALLVYDKIALNGLFETLWALVIGMVLYLVTDLAMRLIRSWSTELISVRLARQSDETLWAKLMAQLDTPAGGFPRFISNYRDLSIARDFVSSSYLLQVTDIPFLLLYLVVIGLVAWQMLIVCLVLVTLYATVGLTLQIRQTRLAKESEQTNTTKLAFLGETLQALDVVRTTPGAGIFLRSWRQLTQQASDSDMQRRLAAQHTLLLTTLMQTLTSIVILTSGVYLIYAQMLSIGQLIACNILAGRTMAQVGSLLAVVGKWQDFTRSATRMEEILRQPASASPTPRPEIAGNIRVIDFTRCYPERPAALDSVSLTLSPGERVALLGKPGAGKSTLLRCLAGLSRGDAGQILVDGVALDAIPRMDRVNWLVYKGQDPALFAGTLDENIRIAGCRDQERLSRALWASGLDSEISAGRMSLGMPLAERGGNLSGGQRQKVALARAFAQPGKILLLDEPSLGLDPEGERLLAARLPQLLDPDTLLVMTTHSPVLLQLVERIIVLDNGRIVADGPREKLLKIQPVPAQATPAAKSHA